MKLRSIKNVRVKNKKVLMRVDYNVPLDGAKILDDRRILDSLPTINYLLKNGAGQITLISHLGRPVSPAGKPEGKTNPKYSLQPIANYLEKKLKLPTSKVTLLENLRFDLREEKNDLEFAQELAAQADIYINDAFSVSHRAHASVTAITKYLPSYAGFALQKEVEMLSLLLEKAQRPFVLIVGGAKISDKIQAIENLSQLADVVLVGGAIANNFLKAEGFNVYKSYLEEAGKNKDFVKFADNLLDENQQEHSLINGWPLPKIIYPIDVLAADATDAKSALTINLLHQSTNQPINRSTCFFDIGPQTIKLFEKVISQAATIFWNGPMGLLENPIFAQGTKKIAQAITQSKAESVIGGGDTIAALEKFKIDQKKFTYVSAAGGAALEFLSGKMLPGIKPLLS